MLGSLISSAIRDGSIGGMHVGSSGYTNSTYSNSKFTTVYAVLHTELCRNITLAVDNGYIIKRKIDKKGQGALADQYALTDLAKKSLIEDGEIQYKLLDVAMPEWKRDWYEDTFKI